MFDVDEPMYSGQMSQSDFKRLNILLNKCQESKSTETKPGWFSRFIAFFKK